MSTLTELYEEIAACTRCELAKSRTKVVPGEGPEDAEIMFIGEAPGFHEDRQGRPFVGAAGRFLDELLASIGLKREEVYIANVIKCFISPRVLIYTAEGYKPIKNIRIGDLVLTHNGRFRKVTYIRPPEILPKGSEVVRFTVRAQEGNTKRPVSMTVTPEHPFLVSGEWKRAADLQVGDQIRALGDRCEICGQAFYVHYSRYEGRTYHTCSPKCHNRRIMRSPEARKKVRQAMLRQYAEGKRDPKAIVARAHERTRQLVAAGEAKIQRMTAEERYRSRIVIAQRITAGQGKHPIGFGEEELKEILNGIGEDYIHHFAFPGSAFTYDFCLPHQRILLEVRGPSFNISKEMQERAMVKDRLAEEHGYLVVNFWWAQIIQRPNMVEAILRRLIRNHNGEYVFVDLIVTQVEHRRTGRNFPLYNIGVEGDESYIAEGIVSHNCRPPGNRDPRSDEIEACRPFLDRQIEIINPKVIVTLGRFSMARYFPDAKITKIHGKPKRVGNRIYYPVFHPAAALHQPRWRSAVEEDFRKIPQLLKEMERIAEEPEKVEQLTLF